MNKTIIGMGLFFVIVGLLPFGLTISFQAMGKMGMKTLGDVGEDLKDAVPDEDSPSETRAFIFKSTVDRLGLVLMMTGVILLLAGFIMPETIRS